MVKELIRFGITKYVNIAFEPGRGVFPKKNCPGILFTKLLINPSFSTSTGFMMAHFEAKIHKKTIKKSQQLCCQRPNISNAFAKWGDGKRCHTKIDILRWFWGQNNFLGYFGCFWTHSVIHGWKAWKQDNFMVKSRTFLGLPFWVQNFDNTLAA